MEWYAIENTEDIDSPALLVYPDRIRANVAEMIRIAGSAARLRPHVKTYKMIEVVRMQLDAGIDKFKCATIAEAEMLCLAGAKDILLAYQPVGPKINRLIALMAQYPTVKIAALIDNPKTAMASHEALQKADATLDIYIDLDTGNHRTGISPEDALELFNQCQELDRLHIVGLHAYDGHLRDSDFDQRLEACNAAFEPVDQLVNAIREVSGKKLTVVAGGSPTFPCHALREDVICSPGTSLLWDWGYGQQLPDLNFQHAAVLLTRIVSRVGSNRVCLDLGHKAIASENPFPRIHFLNLEGVKQVGHSEEHLVLEVDDNRNYEAGEVAYGIPIHICPTTALYEEVQVVRDHQARESWQVVSRKRAINF